MSEVFYAVILQSCKFQSCKFSCPVRTLISIMYFAVDAQKQSTVTLLVPDGTSSQLIILVVVAFILKLIQLFHVIICQVSTD